MAFSLRKMFSNISYFSKSGEHGNPGDFNIEDDTKHYSHIANENIDFPAIEPDSTSVNFTNQLPEKKFAPKKGSLSDTDLLNDMSAKKRNKNKNLKLDIKKASQSLNENLSYTETAVENTPKHISLDCRSADLFSEKLKMLDFSNSFEFDIETDSSEEVDIESMSECSDLESEKDEGKAEFKMCRKVESQCEDQSEPAATPESFGVVELERNDEERVTLLLNYQAKFEKIEYVLKELFTEFKFHVEVSKIFNAKSIISTYPDTYISNVRANTSMDNVNYHNPMESWNFIIEKEDEIIKQKFQKQLQSIKSCIDNFISNYLQQDVKTFRNRKFKRSVTFDLHKGKKIHKVMKISNKKRIKHFDFPDYRDSLLNLFKMDTDSDENNTQISNSDDGMIPICVCQCHNQSLDQSDSGLTSKTDKSNQSITSSIGNFSLDSTTLSAYSESLDMVISYNSFQDTSLISSLLQQPAVDRIVFYIQVHSIQVKSEICTNYKSKTPIYFYCPACNLTENEESGLLKHILSQKHCEKIHFLYKTAYIKKCVASGKEILPSTVLNPMKMYRDDNKIVCFGDAMYACSLCFENLIVGESVLMAHCSEQTHIDHREKLIEIFE